ncbi:B12-binding domain-containing radical SAM protein [Streptomyces turgidiscabies]|uniref:Radical SAM domain protein n=1 Tax=Streptomyces turgidiscabies (strain Car8) TaxID=698760 RepID=L7FGH8_STRT8|nr:MULTISPECIES: radical SAM protein [Streptomyces]ELP69800.1 radical SAM domain protein [Streptomyces turgidiscabies Car8]MDX3496401.1 radical SAM protein [Streptomyces turgidiscabies]GAQ75073.1 radical SAM superfamily protein [Streptomyces turgidiscabies]
MPSSRSVDRTRTDVLLIFPPQTEARFFPYLSLPYLTGHLRRRARQVHQADLNIAVLHELLRCPTLLDDAVRAQDAGDDGTAASHWYHRAVADVFAAHIGELRAHVLHKESVGELGPHRAVRLATLALELLVRDTFLARTWQDLGRLDDAVRRAADEPPVASGVPVAVLHRLVTGLLGRHRPRVVGLSVAFFSQLAPALLIAAWVRQLAPDTRICLGGQQVMLRHDSLVRLPGVRATVDALCTTAGEEPLERWLDALDGTFPLAAVPGMTWLPRSDAGPRTGPPVTLRFRDLGPPDFTGLPFRSYLNDALELAIVSCVGCYWGRCAFCSYGNRSLPQGGYQQGTAAQIADAVEAVVRATGTRYVSVADENTNLRLILKAMRATRDRGIRVRFGVRSRLEAVLTDPAFCHDLSTAGCAMIAVGYEGTSQRLLDRLERGVRAADYQRILDNLAAAGIAVRFTVMGQVLDETPDEFEASLRFLVDNERRIDIDALELMVAEPGSRLVTGPQDYGLALDTSDRLAGNPELSYLAGRVGRPLAVRGGPTRTEALDRLIRTFRTVRPGRTNASAPSSPAPDDRRAPAVAALRPHPWVRTVPAHADDRTADRVTLADVVRERFYALPRTDVEQGADGLLTARTDRGSRLLARLADAAAGTPDPARSADPAPSARSSS